MRSGRLVAKPQRRRADSEERNAGHVKALAAETIGQPARDGKNDCAGDEITGENPRRLFLAGAERTGDVREGDVGDGGVEDLHEGGEGDGERDRPRIVAGLPESRSRGQLLGGRRHISLLI